VFKKVNQSDKQKNTHAVETVELIKELARDVNKRVAVAGDPNTPKEVLAKLADDENRRVREAVAGNPNASRHTLAKLAKDPYSLDAVAENHNTPPHILAKLARHTLAELAKLAKDPYYGSLHSPYSPHDLLLEAIAGNPNTPRRILDKLSKNPHDYIKLEVAKNHNTSQFTLVRLAQDPIGDISRAAKANLTITKEEFDKLAKRVAIHDNIEELFMKIKDTFVDIKDSLVDFFTP
jgi:hypothetical protein